jgi:hypothetical protein
MLTSLGRSQQVDQRDQWREELTNTLHQIRDIREQILTQHRYTVH